MMLAIPTTLLMELSTAEDWLTTMVAYWPPAGASAGTVIVNGISAVELGAMVPVGASSWIQSTIWEKLDTVARSAWYSWPITLYGVTRAEKSRSAVEPEGLTTLMLPE